MSSEVRTLHQSNVRAPWAEIVPGVGPRTVDDLLLLPNDGQQYEIVEGVLVRRLALAR